MENLFNETMLGLMAVAGAIAALPKFRSRLMLSRAKHRSLAGHSRMAKRIARLIPFYEYDESGFFRADDAPDEIVQKRVKSLAMLSDFYERKYRRSAALTRQAAETISDLKFTGSYRVPYQFSRYVRSRLPSGSFLNSSAGVLVTDLDGNSYYDLAGSYGVNVFGYDFYKACIAEGARRVENLGPVLGSYHPIVLDNAEKLKQISGQDEVSFHMSGTEAVMQAVRLARYHTGKKNLVRFCGAYHGWWEDVQPGIGNPMPPGKTYTLSDMSLKSLKVLETRSDIACVLINPLQALHPNKAAPGDSALVDSSRAAGFDREAYTQWLKALREVCTRRGIVLIMDEVFVGFRLAPGGAQEYFDVRADMVTYGKTLGGGLPVGVVCGRNDLMQRFRKEYPADICFARGTFNAHPYVMGAMQVFLEQIKEFDVRLLYNNLDEIWNARAEGLNRQLAAEGLPARVDNLSTIWTVSYTVPSRYNWMFQYYLKAEGLLLSWVGTGRLIFSLNYTDADFAAVSTKFVQAARRMVLDGWWWADTEMTNKTIKRRILGEMWRTRW
ncbi:MAG: aminotransferase class III-fold pyridoxal phosphate-dependent enzyme [Rhodocyclaceae bacterium]|nr:aminotransferase class III-fold pyridoxal phosphate-dependent enzyme [Rhodocyclaceae bacterium]